MSLLSSLNSCTKRDSAMSRPRCTDFMYVLWASLTMGNMTWVASVSRGKILGDGKISTYASFPLTPCIQHKRKPLTLNKTESRVMTPATPL